MDVLRELETGEPLSLASKLVEWPLVVLQQKIPLRPKKFFPISCNCKIDVCKTVDRPPRTANMLNRDNFNSEFLIHGGFIFVKHSTR